MTGPHADVKSLPSSPLTGHLFQLRRVSCQPSTVRNHLPFCFWWPGTPPEIPAFELKLQQWERRTKLSLRVGCLDLVCHPVSAGSIPSNHRVPMRVSPWKRAIPCNRWLYIENSLFFLTDAYDAWGKEEGGCEEERACGYGGECTA